MTGVPVKATFWLGLWLFKALQYFIYIMWVSFIGGSTFWSLTEYNKNLSSQFNLTAQTEQGHDSSVND